MYQIFVVEDELLIRHAKAIHEMARQIDESKAVSTLPRGYDQDEIQLALRQPPRGSLSVHQHPLA